MNNLETAELDPNEIIGSSVFSIDGKTEFRKSDIDQLLEKAIYQKRALVEENEKSSTEEFVADIPTFSKAIGSLANAFTSPDQSLKNAFDYAAWVYSTDPLSFKESLAAIGIIGNLKREDYVRKKSLNRTLNIWSKLQRDIKNEKVDVRQSYKHAFNLILHSGLDYEGLEKIPADIKIDKNDIKKLVSESQVNFLKKALNEGHKLSKTNRLVLARNAKIKAKKRTRTIKHEVGKFLKGWWKNAKDLLNASTAIAVLSGAASSLKIGKDFAYRVRHGLLPSNKELKTMKQAYLKNPVKLANWDHAFRIEKDLKNQYLKAARVGVTFAAETWFMYLHGKEGMHEISDIIEAARMLTDNVDITLTEFNADHLRGEIVNSSKTLLINIFSAVAAAGPWKEFGRELSTISKKISSNTATLTNQFYAGIKDDIQKIRDHEDTNSGFESLTL